jgi:PPOX class probable F420-dependent enzyme
LEEARRAVLATLRPDGRPRLVPITFALERSSAGLRLYTPLDAKRKTVSDPRRLARVRDILQRPAVSVLIDRWREDWSALAWLRLEGEASLLEPGWDQSVEHGRATTLLRSRYRQYAAQRLDQRPIIRIEVQRVTGWSAR